MGCNSANVPITSARNLTFLVVKNKGGFLDAKLLIDLIKKLKNIKSFYSLEYFYSKILPNLRIG